VSLFPGEPQSSHASPAPIVKICTLNPSCSPVEVDGEVAKGYHSVMSQPVKLSNTLVLDARLSAKLTNRSIAGQIEFWAGLGKAIEPLLRFDEVLQLRQRGTVVSIKDCLEAARTAAGERRLKEVIRNGAYPHYEADPKVSGMLIKIEADGTRTRGRFNNREFVAEG